MEPVTLILAALAAGASAGASEIGKEAVVDAWHKLRELIRKRLGDDEDAVADLSVYTRDPTVDKGEALAAQLVKHRVDQDADVNAVAEEVVQLAGPPLVGEGSLAASVVNQIVERGAAIGVSHAPITLTFHESGGLDADPQVPGPTTQ